MKTIIVFLIILSVNKSVCQTTHTDSIKIAYLQMVKATEALIELKNIKKQQGLYQDVVHNKNVTIQYYERLYKKCSKSDSISTVLIANKDEEILKKDIIIYDYKYQNKQQKLKAIGLGITLPVAIVLSFLAGWYLHIK